MIVHSSKKRRLIRVRQKIKTNLGLPRLSVFRSNQHLWAQVIDDKHGHTLAALNTKTLKDLKGTKSEKAYLLGKEIAKIALSLNIKRVRFDRGLSKYHGRVQKLAEGARSEGLIF
jgi:large subunit ribosomal protein L18